MHVSISLSIRSPVTLFLTDLKICQILLTLGWCCKWMMHVNPLILHTKVDYYQLVFLMLVSKSVESLVNISRKVVTFASVEQFLSGKTASVLLPSVILHPLPWWAYLSEEPEWSAFSYNIYVVAMPLAAPIVYRISSFLDISSTGSE